MWGFGSASYHRLHKRVPPLSSLSCLSTGTASEPYQRHCIMSVTSSSGFSFVSSAPSRKPDKMSLHHSNNLPPSQTNTSTASPRSEHADISLPALILRMQSVMEDMQNIKDTTAVTPFVRTTDTNTALLSLKTSESQPLVDATKGSAVNLTDLDNDIRRLQTTIITYTQQLAAESDRRVCVQKPKHDDIHEATVTKASSPIQLLPLELLGEIFLHCLPPTGHPRRQEAPLLLCQICSLWRRTALDLPRLWCSLALSLPGELSPRASSNLSHMTKLWFQRAKAAPMSFNLRYWDHDSMDFCVDRLVNQAILADNSARFRALHLTIQSRSDLHHFFSLPALLRPWVAAGGHRVGQLESLVLKVGMSCIDDEPITVFEGAPRLKRAVLTVGRDWFDVVKPKVVLPWSQLTHLKIDAFIPFRAWRGLFRKCVKLQSCEFSIDLGGLLGYEEVGEEDRGVDGPVVFKDLADMGVVTMPPTHQPRFWLQDMSFPVMSDLSIHYTSIDAAWIHAACGALHPPSLTRLSLKWNSISTDNLIELLRAVPAVAELELGLDLNIHPDSGPLWLALAETNKGKHTLLPSLATLRVRVSTMRERQLQCLVPEICYMVRSRRIGHEAQVEHVDQSWLLASRLQHFALFSCEGYRVVNDLGVVLEDCVEDGLVVRTDGVEWYNEMREKERYKW